MSYFDNKGEVNASNLKDALASVIRYASALENAPSNASLAGNMSDEKRDDLISRAIMTQEGKIALAQSMANPIR